MWPLPPSPVHSNKLREREGVRAGFCGGDAVISLSVKSAAPRESQLQVFIFSWMRIGRSRLWAWLLAGIFSLSFFFSLKISFVFIINSE